MPAKGYDKKFLFTLDYHEGEVDYNTVVSYIRMTQTVGDAYLLIRDLDSFLENIHLEGERETEPYFEYLQVRLKIHIGLKIFIR